MAAVGTDTGGRALPRLHWGAVIAGVFVALAAHIVMGLVGAALGFAAEPADSSALGASAAIWGLITPFVASLLGAWIACRIAAQFDTAGSTLHGVMVWCIGLIAGALFLTGTMATGAMAAGTAASGNAGAMQRMFGAQRVDPNAPRTSAATDRAQDNAARNAAKAAGGAAMAALAGLLGAIAGAGIARSRREGMGLGWRISLQRQDHGRDGGMREREVREREARIDEGYGASGRAATPDQAARPDLGGPADPYHH
jgi:hypothetical protein